MYWAIKILIIKVISVFKKFRNFQQSQPLENQHQEGPEINRPKRSDKNSMATERSLYRTISSIHKIIIPKILK